MIVRRAIERSMELRSGETLELNDRRLLEFLGMNPTEVNVRGNNALKQDTVYACIKILSESVAKLPLKIFQEDDNGIQKAARHPVYQLLKLRPNQHMSASDFWKCIEGQRARGNAYAYIDFDRKTGRVLGLWPLERTKVKVWIDDAGLLSELYPNQFLTNRMNVWYEVDVGKGEKRKLMPDELLHFKGSVTFDGIVGIDPIDYLRSTIENGVAATKFINNFYKQGLQTKGIIQYTGSLDETAKKVFRENFEEMSSGLKNSHRVSLMPLGYQFQPLSLTMVDAQFLENTLLTIRQIATAFGIKMHQLNELDRATHANIEHQQMQFYSDTMQPILTGYEQELTYKLFLDSEIAAGFYAKFNVDSILRGDLKTRYEAYRIGIQGSFLKPNEARAKEDMPPDPHGDVLLVNGSMLPIEKAGQAYAKKGGDGTG